MDISYDHYRVFYYVAQCGNITQAAVLLRNNQPNITRTIKNLEKELGCPLFFRSRQGVTLTPEGEKLYEHIQAAFAHIEAGEATLASVRDLRQGTVSIGTSEIALRCLLVPVLKEYQRLYPGIKLRLTNHSTPQALRALKSGLVDLAVVTAHTPVSPELNSVLIREIRERVVCGPSYGFLRERELTLPELLEYPIVSLGERTMSYRFYSELFLKYGHSFSPSIETETIDQVLLFVENGLGIGFLPEEFLKASGAVNHVELLNLKEDLPPRKILLADRPEPSLSIAARKLKEMILACRTPGKESPE